MNCKRLILTAVMASALLAAGQSYAGPIDLGTAGNFVILAKTGISTAATSSIFGNIGLSPAAASLIEGFGLALDGSGKFSTSSQVFGKVYASDYTEPTPTNMTAAISDMEAAYTDAAGRAALAGDTNLGAGSIGGMTFIPGVYKWTTNVTIPTDVTLSGGAGDVWIFQIEGTLDVGSGTKVNLGGAQASNIFWQVADVTTLGTTSEFKGTILAKTLIAMQNGATLDGRALAQTEVTLIHNTITPEPCTLLLLGSGLAGLVAARRRSRCAS